MKKLFCLFLLLLFFLTGCANVIFTVGYEPVTEEKWGSFTPDQTYSHDGAYYAVSKVVMEEDLQVINVEIYTADGMLVGSFRPVRARDFWGICWEDDSYDIWVQSGDVGLLCYAYTDGEWKEDPTALRPDNVVSKYDP